MIEQLPDLTAALSTDLAAVIAAAPEGAQAGYVDGQKILDSAAGNINRAADWVAIVLLLLGVGFSFLSTVGLLRMPDLYTRMQAAAKAGTLGMACTILAVAAHFAPTPAGPGVLVTTLLIMIFIFMTTPAASHL
ncbi:MAG: monovalent cation/H(+) antiporter subunit G, partial [Planctomycetota bacterium]